MAKRDYAVGRGKPPVASQFKKGQSGNPGGKRRPTKTFQQRFRIAFDEALKMTYEDLNSSGARTVLDDVAKEIVLNAARGRPQAIKTLLMLTDKYSEADVQAASNEKNSTQLPTSAGGAPKVETQGVTLSQGNSQGNFESEAPAEAITQPDQQVDASADASSGNTSGTDAPSPNEVDISVHRPRRPTITIAGVVVQQGD
jgi:uncharacterized protein DUF5681